MRLGYQRILKKTITFQESDDPMITLKVPGYDEMSFKVSEGSEAMDTQMLPEVREIIDIAHQVYIDTINCRF